MGWRWWRSQSAVTCRNTILVTVVINFPPSQGGQSSFLPCAVAFFKAVGLMTQRGRDKHTVIIHLHPVHKPFSPLTFLYSFLLSLSLRHSICVCVCPPAALSDKHSQTHKQWTAATCAGEQGDQISFTLLKTHIMILWTDVVILHGCACILSCVQTHCVFIFLFSVNLCKWWVCDSFSIRLRLTERADYIGNMWICCLSRWLMFDICSCECAWT